MGLCRLHKACSNENADPKIGSAKIDEYGGDEGARTPGLDSAIVALSQLSYIPRRNNIVAHHATDCKRQLCPALPCAARAAGLRTAPKAMGVRFARNLGGGCALLSGGASPAEAKQRQMAWTSLKAILRQELRIERLEHAVVKLDDGATVFADQVMVRRGAN